MNDLLNALGRLFSAVIGLVLWLFAAALGLLLAAVVAVLLLVGVVWAVVRGRRPVRPVYVHQFQAYARERVWPGRRSGAAATTASGEVVDVQVREVRDVRDVRDVRNDARDGRDSDRGASMPTAAPATER